MPKRPLSGRHLGGLIAPSPRGAEARKSPSLQHPHLQPNRPARSSSTHGHSNDPPLPNRRRGTATRALREPSRKC